MIKGDISSYIYKLAMLYQENQQFYKAIETLALYSHSLQHQYYPLYYDIHPTFIKLYQYIANIYFLNQNYHISLQYYQKVYQLKWLIYAIKDAGILKKSIKFL